MSSQVINEKTKNIGDSGRKYRSIPPNSTAKCDTLQYQEAKAISSNIMAACLKPKHFLGR